MAQLFFRVRNSKNRGIAGLRLYFQGFLDGKRTSQSG